MNNLYSSFLNRASSPALVWYSRRGRIELSGAVLARHLAKNAAFLEAECEGGSSSGVVIDLPVDWKMVTWALGTLLAGAPLAFFDVKGMENQTSTPILLAPNNGTLANCDPTAVAWGGIVFSNESPNYLRARTHAKQAGESAGVMPIYPKELLEAWPSLVAVDLAPLALRWADEPLHASVLDGNAESMGYPDFYSPHAPTSLTSMDVPCDAGAWAWATLGASLARAHNSPAAHTSAIETSPFKENVNESYGAICVDFSGLPLDQGAISAACFAICLHYIRYGCVVVATDGKAEDIARAERAQLVSFASLCPQA